MLGTVTTSLFEILQQRRGRVLFVSGKNTCRSQIAEAFARALGGDVLEAASAGTSPGPVIPRYTRDVVQEQGISLGADQRPKNLDSLNLAAFDVIVNLGACALPETGTMVLSLPLPAPPDENDAAADLSSLGELRDRVEAFVMFLVEHFRRAKEWRIGVEQASSIPARQTNPTPPPTAPPPPDAAMPAAF